MLPFVLCPLLQLRNVLQDSSKAEAVPPYLHYHDPTDEEESCPKPNDLPASLAAAYPIQPLADLATPPTTAKPPATLQQHADLTAQFRQHPALPPHPLTRFIPPLISQPSMSADSSKPGPSKISASGGQSPSCLMADTSQSSASSSPSSCMSRCDDAASGQSSDSNGARPGISLESAVGDDELLELTPRPASHAVEVQQLQPASWQQHDERSSFVCPPKQRATSNHQATSHLQQTQSLQEAAPLQTDDADSFLQQGNPHQSCGAEWLSLHTLQPDRQQICMLPTGQDCLSAAHPQRHLLTHHHQQQRQQPGSAHRPAEGVKLMEAASAQRSTSDLTPVPRLPPSVRHTHIGSIKQQSGSAQAQAVLQATWAHEGEQMWAKPGPVTNSRQHQPRIPHMMLAAYTHQLSGMNAATAALKENVPCTSISTLPGRLCRGIQLHFKFAEPHMQTQTIYVLDLDELPPSDGACYVCLHMFDLLVRTVVPCLMQRLLLLCRKPHGQRE